MDAFISFKNELLDRTIKPQTEKAWFHTQVIEHSQKQLVDFADPMLWVCVGSIVFNPVFWNTVARNEYRNKTLTKVFGGPKQGTYFLAVVIFSLGILRDYIYKEALSRQPSASILASPVVQIAGIVSFVVGQVLVLTSIYALGITGTYLGDYFGILMKSRVTGFPFNVMEDPMYNGSTLCFIGTAIWYKKPAGLVLSVLVFIVYRIALTYEGPFTGNIYSSAAAKKSGEEPPKRLTNPVSASSGTSSATRPSTQSQKTTAGHSYADAAAHAASSSGLPSTDPKPVPELRVATPDEETSGSDRGKVASPKGPVKRVTRSRSRAKLVED